MISVDPSIENFVSAYPLRKVKKSQTLVFQSEVPRSIYYINSGRVRIYAVDKNGIESNISYVSEGSFLPVEVLFGISNSSLHYFETCELVEIVAIPKDDIHNELEVNHKFSNALLSSIATKYVGSKLHIQALEHSLAQDKILRIMQYLVLRFGTEKQPSHWAISLKLKQHDIANLVGVTRETAATELGKLKKLGIIDYDSFQYVVDMNALQRFIGSEGWEELEIN